LIFFSVLAIKLTYETFSF